MGKEVYPADVGAVGGIGELEAEDLGVVLRLLETVASGFAIGLGLDDGEGEVASVAEKEIGELLLEPARNARRDDDPAIGERGLFAVRTGKRVPSGCFEPGTDQLSAGVRFVHAGPVASARLRAKHT